MSTKVRLIAGTVALLVVYFTVPVHLDEQKLVLRAVLTALSLGAATVIIVRQVRHQMRDGGSPLWSLALAMVGGVLAFALADYVIAVTWPGEFTGLSTRLDALYFALTTLATVGYGDVHAEGQTARAVVSIQLVFNILVLTTAASFLVTQLKFRAKASGS